MPPASYSKSKTGKAKAQAGKRQYQNSLRGDLHANFNVVYGHSIHPLDLFRQTFRVLLRVAGEQHNISKLVEQLTWQDDSGDSGATLAYMNVQPTMTGSLQMRKPALRQYDKLAPSFLSSKLTQAQRGVSKWGALGAVVVCEVGYAGSFTPVWAMRCQPTSQGSTLNGAAEEVDVTDGTWSLTLADDTQLLNLSMDDFKFTKGKVTRKRGWRADEIAAVVCRQFRIPVKQLTRGTAHFELPTSQTSNVSPMMVISDAYTEEANRTGKAFVVRWAAPDKKFPLGALEVVPFRRNPHLLKFRDQLTNAQLTRSQSPEFATAIRGRATLKGSGGKSKKLTFDYHNDTAIRRFGWVFKTVDFNTVSSMQELQILTKRALAFRLTSLRMAELTHPGVATLRRGDAIRINIPEEGYAPLPLTVYGTPRLPKSKKTAAALKQAMKADPGIFGLPDPSLLNPTSSAATNVDPTTGLTQDTAVITPVANQSIAFVSSVTHTAAVGSYSMDMTCSFVDILDPATLKAEIDANKRNAKALQKAAQSQVTTS